MQTGPLGATMTRAITAERAPGVVRFVRFGLVGVSGLVVNTAALAIAVGLFDAHYLLGVILATQASTVWNFVWTDTWVFRTDDRAFGQTTRFAQFWAMNNAALLVRGPMVFVLTDFFGAHYLVSNLASLIVLMLARYGLSSRVIWQPAPSAQPRLITPAAPPDDGGGQAHDQPPPPDPDRLREWWLAHPVLLWISALGVIAVPAMVLRITFLDSLGFNSDEAVYAGQAASISGDTVLVEYFPIFRAHPLLFQTTLSVVYQFGVSPLAGRLVAVAFGLGTVAVTYLLAKTLYSRRAGVFAALILAVMPYHVVVTRQVLLDGPMVFFATTALYLLARFAQTGRVGWFYASSATIGLTVLTNERSVVLLGSAYLFFALLPTVKIAFRQLVVSLLIFGLVVLPYPLSTFFSGKSTTGEQFLAWQLFRRANHGIWFYVANVPVAMGFATLIAAGAGLIVLRRRNGWREVLIGCWCAVPLVFFQIWPVKGFQYLLALAPPVAVLAARALDAIPDRVTVGPTRIGHGIVRVGAVALVAAMLATSSWARIDPSGAGESFLAGSGGVPGGREAGEWVGANLPQGAELMAVGPSMANIIQWYGDRKVYGLSVSPNPLHRNPVYEPVVNPDLLLRNGDLHYLVWDSFSASRSTFFSEKLLTFAERYNGRIIHQEFVEVTTDDGEPLAQPVIIIYEVRP